MIDTRNLWQAENLYPDQFKVLARPLVVEVYDRCYALSAVNFTLIRPARSSLDVLLGKTARLVAKVVQRLSTFLALSITVVRQGVESSGWDANRLQKE
ncbi:MAG: hypothetical protein OXI60_00890 [Acidiferrobacterales bacterium]|nr:hypothetical protein [Acidiferrobacterales bacterium]